MIPHTFSPDDVLDVLAAQLLGGHVVKALAEAVRDRAGEAAAPRLTVGGRRREDLEAELAGRLLTAPVLADPLAAARSAARPEWQVSTSRTKPSMLECLL